MLCAEVRTSASHVDRLSSPATGSSQDAPDNLQLLNSCSDMAGAPACSFSISSSMAATPVSSPPRRPQPQCQAAQPRGQCG